MMDNQLTQKELLHLRRILEIYLMQDTRIFELMKIAANEGWVNFLNYAAMEGIFLNPGLREKLPYSLEI